MAKRKSRSIFLAFLANLFYPPVGHFYVGRPLLGISIILIATCIYLVIASNGAATSLFVFYLMLSVILITYIVLIINGAVLASKSKNYELKIYNKWYIYAVLMIIIYILFLTALVSKFDVGFRTFRIPTKAMVPTLQVGDIIVSDTQEYFSGKIPKRGDIVTFSYPKNDSLSYVKRVIALPGERISIENSNVFINGELLEEDYKYINKVLAQRDDKFSNEFINFAEIVIPDDHIFVIGDNRFASTDSRQWGPLPITYIFGKVNLIPYAENKNRIGKIDDHVYEKL